MGKLQENHKNCCRANMEENEAAFSMDSVNYSENSEASSSLDMVEEEAISPISSSSSSNGPLFELSELMVNLPIKRGLSKYYDGKSESFRCLGSVENLEDLAKRVSPIRKKFKSWKSFGGGFDSHKSIVPKAAIAKKASSSRGKKTSFLCGSTRSAISVNGH